MTKIACQYAIVRFSPYLETGEFANVGILMIAPKHRYFGFKLAVRRYGRITRFFDELNPTFYCNTFLNLKEELERVHELLKTHGFDRPLVKNDVDFALSLFSEIIRSRESVIRFSEPRVVLTEEPKNKLNELFSFYVERNFVTKPYREVILEKGVRKWLSQAQIGDRFQRMAVGDDHYQTIFPFVELRNNQPTKVIKPLNLTQAKASKIIDHGGAWLFRLKELRDRNTLPDKVLFTIAGPEDADNHRRYAFEETVGRLEKAGVEVAPYADRERVLAFARMQ